MGHKNKLNLSRVLLAAAILMIVAFQAYWLKKIYRDEYQALRKETNGIFRDVIYNVQVQRFTHDSLPRIVQGKKIATGGNLFASTAVNALRIENKGLVKKDTTPPAPPKDTTPAKPPVRIVVGKRVGGVMFSRTNIDDSTGRTINTYKMEDGGIMQQVDLGSSELTPEMIEKIAMAQIKVQGVRLPPRMDSVELKKLSTAPLNVVINLKKSVDTNSVLMAKPKAVVSNVFTDRPRKYFASSVAENKGVATVSAAGNLVARTANMRKYPTDNKYIRLITNGKVIDDTIPVRKLDSAYRKELMKAGIPLSFYLKEGADDSLHWNDTIAAPIFSTATAGTGLFKPHWYQAGFEDPTTFLLKKISMPILFSVFLVAFTSVTFMFLYRNLIAQRKLTEMKNDFISNITHELKTPLATVSVAVEALRNFGGIENPTRTKEYLDISASELQRLNLLVDKVLKLSLFENRELELKKETFDLKQLTEEVLNTMKLQFDTHRAKVQLEVKGNYFTILADRLHITSVIFNLLDNALKYSKSHPEITIRLQHHTDRIVLQVEDKGIGIEQSFTNKIFDRFFRVPTGNHHNIKGYGLGLSYVAHVIQQHNGTISVESEPGTGSIFTVKFPIT